MTTTDIKIVGGQLAAVECRIDGVVCDASLEYKSGAAVPVVRQVRHPSPVVCSGEQVPAEIVEALHRARELAREHNRAALADYAGESAGVGPHFESFDSFTARRHG